MTQELPYFNSKIGGDIIKDISHKNGEELIEITKRKDQILKLLGDKLDVSYLLRSQISYPNTSSLKSVIEDQYSLKLEYDTETTWMDLYNNLKEKDLMTKYQCESYVEVIIKLLFSKSFSPNPCHFDYVVVQYHSIPLVVAKNKKAEGRRFSLFLELSSFRQALIDKSAKFISSMLLEEIKEQAQHQKMKQEKLSWFVQISSTIFNVATSVVMVYLIHKSVKNKN